VLLNLIGPAGAANAGCFRPLTVLTRPGSVFDLVAPAACGVYYEVRIRLYDLILRCLAPHLEGRLPAGGFASICATFIGGSHPDTGRPFIVVEPEVGGWGATAERDGLSAQFSAVHGDTFTCPIEVAEARYGLDVERLELSGARGEDAPRRGHFVVDTACAGTTAFLTCAYTRSTHPPGQGDGSPNLVEAARRRHARAARGRPPPAADGDDPHPHGQRRYGPGRTGPSGADDLRDGQVRCRGRGLRGGVTMPAAAGCIPAGETYVAVSKPAPPRELGGGAAKGER
jgi:N-methylhydantoinase B